MRCAKISLRQNGNRSPRRKIKYRPAMYRSEEVRKFETGPIRKAPRCLKSPRPAIHTLRLRVFALKLTKPPKTFGHFNISTKTPRHFKVFNATPPNLRPFQ